MDLGIDERNLVELLQEGELSHSDLHRRVCRIRGRLAAAVQGAVGASQDGSRVDAGRAALELFDACVPAMPYAAAGAFLGREKFKLARSDSDHPRVALVTDGLGLRTAPSPTFCLHGQVRPRKRAEGLYGRVCPPAPSRSQGRSGQQKPRFGGLLWRWLKGLEPSTFCMASHLSS
jgi:hypothetical protein